MATADLGSPMTSATKASDPMNPHGLQIDPQFCPPRRRGSI